MGGKTALHCLTLAVKSLSYARVTLRGRSCPTWFHQGKEEKTEAHQLVQLTAANYGKLPMSMYIELNLEFLGFMVLEAAVLPLKTQKVIR